MWMPGALIGGLLAYQIYSEVWALGAVVGALAGLILGRTIAKPPGEQRLAAVEAQVAEEHERIDWLDRRVAELERSDRPAPTTAAAPEATVAEPATTPAAPVEAQPPEPRPIQSPFARPPVPRVSAPFERWANLPDVLALAKYPNVAMKATGAPSYSDQPYPFRDIHDNLRRLYDAFGPARWFWGTDITRMPCPWRPCVTLFTEELPWLKGRDLELVMGRAVCDWLGWKR